MKTLGIIWSIHDDKISYSVHSIKITKNLTKQSLLSDIAKIYDPLELLGPIILYAKKLMQDVWRSGLNWDESVPQSIYTEWTEFTRQLDLINQFSIDRTLLTGNHREIQVHGFCDASNVGYGAVIYVRSIDECGSPNVRILCAKSRVAPLKTVTIPRLALCGAMLLTRLFCEVNRVLNVSSNNTIFWTDSTIVLHCLNSSTHLLKTYVANRVAEIQRATDVKTWRHVKSGDNPADALSRRQMPRAFLQNRLWITGPSWLVNDESEWPKGVISNIEIPELKKNTCLIATCDDPDILERYSSYSKLLRVVAYCLRFVPNNKYN